MKTFIMLSQVTDEGRKTIKEDPDRINMVNKAVEGMGVRIQAQYALLGEYDFLTILEAEDEKPIFKIAMELGSRGTLRTITLPAFQMDAFIQEIKA